MTTDTMESMFIVGRANSENILKIYTPVDPSRSEPARGTKEFGMTRNIKIEVNGHGLIFQI